MQRKILKEIISLTRKLIECGLAINHNHPIERNAIVSWSKQKDLSIVLKNIDYREIYHEINNSKNYNLKMLDGALIQMLYKFSRRSLIEHTLAFYPSPDLERYQDNIKDYEEYYYGEGIYADIIPKHIVSFPLRFDFSITNHINIDHPKSHLHLGLYSDCRIPVTSPITPNLFIKFIVRNFYTNVFKKKFKDYSFSTIKMEKTISEDETKFVHITLP